MSARAIYTPRVPTGRGLAPLHIHSDGRLETHAELGDRLIAELGLAENLFRDRDALRAEAYRRRGRALGFARPQR